MSESLFCVLRGMEIGVGAGAETVLESELVVVVLEFEEEDAEEDKDDSSSLLRIERMLIPSREGETDLRLERSKELMLGRAVVLGFDSA